MKLYSIANIDQIKSRHLHDSIGVSTSIVGYEPDINPKNSKLLLPTFIKEKQQSPFVIDDNLISSFESETKSVFRDHCRFY